MHDLDGHTKIDCESLRQIAEYQTMRDTRAINVREILAVEIYIGKKTE